MTNIALNPPGFGDIVFLDGIARSGKKLSCRLISNFLDIEYFQYIPTIEMLCFLTYMEKIDRSAAASLIRIATDEAVYNRAIGRNLNGRIHDETSFIHAFDSERYTDRQNMENAHDSYESFVASGRLALFHTHSALSAAPLLFETIPTLKLIHITRHPVDLAEDWRQRGWGKRLGADPLAFEFLIETSSGPAPWFAGPWAEKYSRISEEERCILSILSLGKMDAVGRGKIRTDRSTQFHEFAYEHLITSPDKVISALTKFLKRGPGPRLKAFLKDENCPSKLPAARRADNFRALAQRSSETTRRALLDASTEYEKAWGLDAIEGYL